MEFDSNAIEWVFRALNRMHLNYIENELEKRGFSKMSHPPILFILRYEMSDKVASQKELADFLGVRPSTIAISIKRMEKAGLVRKVSDGNDLRRNIITLTEKGEKLVDESSLVFDEIDKRMYEGFTEEEKEKLKKYYIRIMKNLENMGIQSPVQFRKE
jgi:DNA-binding MarR family transcriptional regulator